MTPGTILFDDNFTYSDGTKGKKLIILLNNGVCGYYLIVKTTSQPKFKGITYGCQNSDRYPNFYLPLHSCAFTKHTWVLLDQYFTPSTEDIASRVVSGDLKQIGVLVGNIFEELLDCVIESADISGIHKKMLQGSR